MFATRNSYRDADNGDVGEGLFNRSDVRIVQYKYSIGENDGKRRSQGMRYQYERANRLCEVARRIRE